MDHIFEQKLVRENHQLQFELVKLNKQIKQLQEKVVGYEQILSQLDEGEKRNIRIATSLAKKQDISAVGTEKLKSMDSYVKNTNITKGSVAGAAAEKALAPMKAQVQQGIANAQAAAQGLKSALTAGTNKVERSREARLARGTFSTKPTEKEQAGRIKELGGDHTGGFNMHTSSQILAKSGKLPSTGPKAVPAEVQQKLKTGYAPGLTPRSM
jgi:hypothetical protein